ncbi:unnamed protein product, partial [Rotaria magnacalcarata]
MGSDRWLLSDCSTWATKVLRQRSVGKHMFAIFFMESGFNTIVPLENGKTVTAKWAAVTMEYLDTQHVKLMAHPAYTPDLSPCDFWLFPKIKEQIR